MSKRLTSVLVTGAAATALFAAGCGSDSPSKSTSTMQMHNTAAATSDVASDSGAATLRAGLTALLQEHVYLAGIAVSNGVDHGLTSKQFKAAAGTLDANSVALSKAIGSVYGTAA